MEGQGLEGAPWLDSSRVRVDPSCVRLSRCGSERFCLASRSCVAHDRPSFS